jgi:glycosyltransferase involved in cell wall biosynthesis
VRIAIDASRTVVAQRTGTERYSLELIRALLRIDEADDFLLYFNQAPQSGLLPSGPRQQQRIIPMSRLWTHLSLSRALQHDRPDLLFVPAHVLPLRHPTRSVVTVHDLGFRRYPWAHPPLARLYLELSTRWAARQATRLLAVSQATAADLRSHYGVPPEQIDVVYEGVDPVFRPTREPGLQAALRERHKLGGKPYLLAVGTLQPRKNLRGLLQAYRLLLDRRLEAPTLVLAGRSGWGERALERSLEQLGLQQAVVRTGYIGPGFNNALQRGPALRSAVALRRLRANRAGGDGLRNSGSSVEQLVAAGGRRRRGSAGGCNPTAPTGRGDRVVAGQPGSQGRVRRGWATPRGNLHLGSLRPRDAPVAPPRRGIHRLTVAVAERESGPTAGRCTTS